MRKVNLFLTTLLTCFIYGCNAGGSTSSPSNNITFLAKPTGTYGIGFQDLHFQDNSRCPDVYYSQTTKDDYSPDNTNHCREIMVRAWYPTNQAITPGVNYYAPQVSTIANLYTDIAKHLSPSTVLNFSQFYAVQTYDYENVVLISNAGFPVVLFSPGSNEDVQHYENVIANLVSHGYVVLGVNSLFLGGYVTLPDGHIITAFSNQTDVVDRASRISDIIYVYNNLNSINQQLSNSMDITNIGLMGHSSGANAVASITALNQYPFKAAIAMDADVQPTFEAFSIPFLQELSGTRYWVGKYGEPSDRITYTPHYQLNKNNYLVGFVPTLTELLNPPQYGPVYSTHGSFTDDSTLHYMPLYQTMIPLINSLEKIIFQGNSLGNAFGSGNGYEITNSINTYAVQFFDTYLKNKPNQVFNANNCAPLTQNTIISCGPTTFP